MTQNNQTIYTLQKENFTVYWICFEIEIYYIYFILNRNKWFI